ncbi:hypothetical protein PR048_023639 [Dryococelus australis]|uniref:Protein quiver n=1 Tax=Dryococelus australis TaxID=614101 RepID=A0ABQ9GUL1_9NEOP|nr:hypothetical protein PR048_023639 [Dryococelus australis]
MVVAFKMADGDVTKWRPGGSCAPVPGGNSLRARQPQCPSDIGQPLTRASTTSGGAPLWARRRHHCPATSSCVGWGGEGGATIVSTPPDLPPAENNSFCLCCAVEDERRLPPTVSCALGRRRQPGNVRPPTEMATSRHGPPPTPRVRAVPTQGHARTVVVILDTVYGDGLACWVCSSDKQMSQQYCTDPFNISAPFVYTMDCSTNLQQSTRPDYQHYCVKLVIKPQLGRPVTHRKCMWGPQFNPELELCSQPTDSVDTIEQCHVCAITGCNGSSRPHPLGSTLTLLGWLVLRS